MSAFTRRARYLTFAGVATLGLAAAVQLAVTPAATSAEGDTHEVPLHNTTTNDKATDCPGSPAQFGWHFVVPANGEFESLSVTFQNAGTITLGAGEFGPPDDSHAYVNTPTADTLVSGTAVITGDAKFFTLSHTCDGGGTTGTPTPTPTTTVSEKPSETPSATVSATVSETPSETPSETVSETPSETPSETVSETPSETPSATVSATASETVSETPSAEVSATETTTTSATPSGTAEVLPTRLTNTPTPSASVQGVKVLRPAVGPNALPSTGTPVPVFLMLLLGFGLVGAGVVTTIAGEPRAAIAGGRHRA